CGQACSPSTWQLTVDHLLTSGAKFRKAGFIIGEQLIPMHGNGLAFFPNLLVVFVNLIGNVKKLIGVETEIFFNQFHLLFAKRRTVGTCSIHFIWTAISDLCTYLD